MKATQELKELRSRDSKELYQEIRESENKLCLLQFRSSFKKIKNFREIRHLKKRQARIWTILAERALAEISQKATKEEATNVKK